MHWLWIPFIIGKAQASVLWDIKNVTITFLPTIYLMCPLLVRPNKHGGSNFKSICPAIVFPSLWEESGPAPQQPHCWESERACGGGVAVNASRAEEEISGRAGCGSGNRSGRQPLRRSGARSLAPPLWDAKVSLGKTPNPELVQIVSVYVCNVALKSAL